MKWKSVSAGSATMDHASLAPPFQKFSVARHCSPTHLTTMSIAGLMREKRSRCSSRIRSRVRPQCSSARCSIFPNRSPPSPWSRAKINSHSLSPLERTQLPNPLAVAATRNSGSGRKKTLLEAAASLRICLGVAVAMVTRIILHVDERLV